MNELPKSNPAETPLTAAQAASPITPTIDSSGAAAAAPAPTEELIDYEYFSKIKFRVAKILSAELVPKSKKLIKLQLDLGALGQRQILAGIAEFKTPESLVGQSIVIVANLKPAKMMGLESQGMMLAAGGIGEFAFSLLQPSTEVAPGAPVK